MSDVFLALWRAVLYCLHPRVILLSLLPILLATALFFGLAWFYWEAAIEAVRVAVDGWPWLQPAVRALDSFTGGAFHAVIGPLVVVAIAIPVLLIVSLLLVSAFMGATVVRLVAARRFPLLEAKRGAGWWQSMAWSVTATLIALLALLVSLPLWLVPPLALVLPPLVWGWLSYRVMSFDALAEHASVEERRTLLQRHRWRLFTIGLVTGYLGAAPSLVWVGGAMTLVMMPVLLPAFVWLYTLVFALAALWFTHYCLAALAQLRLERAGASDDLPPSAPPPLQALPT
jgi:hypothetical protein